MDAAPVILVQDFEHVKIGGVGGGDGIGLATQQSGQDQMAAFDAGGGEPGVELEQRAGKNIGEYAVTLRQRCAGKGRPGVLHQDVRIDAVARCVVARRGERLWIDIHGAHAHRAEFERRYTEHT